MDVFAQSLRMNLSSPSSGYTQKCLDRAIEKLQLARKTNDITLIPEVIEDLQVISPPISKNPSYEDLTTLIKDGRGC
jgi:hypothetical protein